MKIERLPSSRDRRIGNGTYPPVAAVVGAGAWGTALATAFSRGGYCVNLWTRQARVVASIRDRRRNSAYLSDVQLPDGLTATTDLACALRGAEVVVMAVPSSALRVIARRIGPLLPADVPVLFASKGLELGSGAFMTEVAEAVFAGRLVGVLTGPGFAAEVTRGEPTVLTLAMAALSGQKTVGRGAREFAETFKARLASGGISVAVTDDVVGAQVGGALKNVIAIACGMAAGRGFGENARAAIITRGFEDMRKLAVALGGRAETLLGSCGAGDVFLTCASTQSRNYRLGVALARGDEPPAGVVEGINTAEAVRMLEQDADIDLRLPPVIRALWAHEISPEQALERLLGVD